MLDSTSRYKAIVSEADRLLGVLEAKNLPTRTIKKLESRKDEAVIFALESPEGVNLELMPVVPVRMVNFTELVSRITIDGYPCQTSLDFVKFTHRSSLCPQPYWAIGLRIGSCDRMTPAMVHAKWGRMVWERSEPDYFINLSVLVSLGILLSDSEVLRKQRLISLSSWNSGYPVGLSVQAGKPILGTIAWEPAHDGNAFCHCYGYVG